MGKKLNEFSIRIAIQCYYVERRTPNDIIKNLIVHCDHIHGCRKLTLEAAV